MHERPPLSVAVTFADEFAVLDYAHKYGGWIAWSVVYPALWYWYDASKFTMSAILDMMPGTGVVAPWNTFLDLKATIS